MVKFYLVCLWAWMDWFGCFFWVILLCPLTVELLKQLVGGTNVLEIPTIGPSKYTLISMFVVTKVHVILRRSRMLTWVHDNNEIVQHVTLWITQRVNFAMTIIMTTGCMWVCGLNSLVDYFNIKIHNIWEGNMMTRRESWTWHICS